MTEAVNGTGTVDWGQGTTDTSGNGEVNKDAFLKLLTAQIAYQNPLDPMDDKEFMSQLAQFTALEQAMETNVRLEAIAMQQAGLANTAGGVAGGAGGHDPGFGPHD